ncbi:MAG: bifunctional [glutamine synthetase] adenylyltransferase/[glutamine synthetase]-adenylyl-L-tyrosine phosphorylase [Pseudomonadota bacterium]
MGIQSTSLQQVAPNAIFAGHGDMSQLPGALRSGLAGGPSLLKTLAAAAHFSPFLRALIERHTDFLLEVADTPSQSVIDALLEELTKAFGSQLALRTALRQVRQKLMLYLAIGDCGCVIGLFDLTRALSDLADTAIQAAMRYELAQLTAKGRLPCDAADPAQCGIGVLGLGKLGGRELNYSSDIDVVCYYDPELFAYEGPKDKKSAAVQLMRNVFGHISARTAEGFVFRVDLRLRPDPSSTPIVMTLDAAENYYQTKGLTWERAAMIKARHCAGDARISADFLSRIRPFIWRRHLDFAAIDDVHAMKQRVHAHHNHDETARCGPGYDVKLGHGGIREIEFFAQIQQLIMGGRRPDLQIKATCDVLRALMEAGDLGQSDYDGLTGAYAFLRTAEHRLQMVQDEQTHCLPEDREGVAVIAGFLGLRNEEALFDALERHGAFVSQQFDNLLGDQNNTPTAIETAALPEKLQAVLARWEEGRYRALSSARTRQLLKDVLPDLLFAFSQTPDPGETALVFDAFLEQLPAGVQIFSLLDANRPLIPLMANIMGLSPELSGQLTRRPALFEGLINEPLQAPLPDQTGMAQDLAISLSGATGYETALDYMRIWNSEARFQAGVRLLEGLCSPAETRRAFGDIAEVSLRRLMSNVETQFAYSHGVIPGGEFGIIGLGSFGAGELVTASDLDLTFLYRAPGPAAVSDGPRALPVSTYYARLAQRVITGITSLTGEGRLYEVDMRLRPSGRSGIIAVSLDAFSAYHQSDAWLWERMSLTKARFVAGPAPLAQAFDDVRASILEAPVPETRLRMALWDMRAKLDNAAPKQGGIWPLKGGDGGLRDADFLVEGLLLKQGAGATRAARWEDWWACLDQPERRDIQAAHALLLDARSVRALLLPQTIKPQDATTSTRAKLTQLLGFEDFDAATRALKAARHVIFDGLQTLLPPPSDTP